jgi:hypothetical protein
MAVYTETLLNKIYDLLIADSTITDVVRIPNIYKWLPEPQYKGTLINLIPDTSDRARNSAHRREEDIIINVAVVNDITDHDPFSIFSILAPIETFFDTTNRKITIASGEVAFIEDDEGNFQVDYSIDEDNRHRIATLTIEYKYRKDT